MSIVTSGPAACVACGCVRPPRVVERFPGGTFAECPDCGVHFGDTDADLETYYRDIWSPGNLACLPYAEKVRAAADPARLRRLLSTLPRFRWALSRTAELPAGSKVLDLGCGEGSLLWAVQGQGHEAHGADLSPPAVELARSLVGEGRVHVGGVGDLPYAPGTFDCVIALEVLEHLPDPRGFVAAASRLLKPSGQLMLSVPNRHRVFAVLKRAMGRRHSSTDYPPHHLTRWSAGALRRLLGVHFGSAEVGSLPYGSDSWHGRLAAAALHLVTAGRMGQTLHACARGPRRGG